jgi:glucose/arabinose dehydrogenase
MWIVGAAFIVGGCGDDGMEADAGLDGAARDATVEDGAAPIDGARPDATTTDGGEPTDAGTDDGGAMDGGSMDGGPTDGGASDGGATDGGGSTCVAPMLPSLSTVDITATRFTRPVLVRQPPGTTDTLFVVETRGLIRVVRGGTVLPTPFLDLQARIGPAPSGGSERGLLGLAFHPDYATNRRFFVMFTPTGGTSQNHDIIAEYRRNATNPDVADPTEVAVLVDTGSSETNHNGGNLEFGPDGMLYAGTGDGGGGGDAHGTYGNGLNRGVLLGKILRLDVDASGSGYAAAGNPFTLPTGLPQIWAYGLRNPWRFAFDRLTGDLYIGDVGQNTWEEIDFQPASSTGGENYGWRAYEGTVVYDAALTGMVPVHAAPIVTNRHGSASATLRGACSISGGRVYRGSAIPALAGVYLYGDYCSDDVAALRYCDGMVRGPVRVPDLGGIDSSLVSVGEDLAGELYFVYLTGRIARIVSP